MDESPKTTLEKMKQILQTSIEFLKIIFMVFLRLFNLFNHFYG
ncbi:MAG: hypothetical protein JETT_2063 [Candidatus Jettenia ecosi]|uniref:Uncharacterized protein n=1 Tax=Candidatus Jettenia ecosi TaxID=2494326 RepID=A0A533QAK0_9BACT|nr:MAG: hypothetical protein JETT_2063 [Candidatus Jettenia ecosi]